MVLSLIGRKLGKYEIVQLLGRGGMATVYKGYHREIDRYSAIKVLPPHPGRDPKYVQRFRQEARAIARMHAACIGTVDGVRLFGPDQLKDATTQRSEGPDKVILDLDLQFGLGFIVPSSLLQLGGPSSFGHFGMGGSAGWADPDAGFAFGYVMNKMELGMAGDLRSYSLINACYDAIK